MALRFFVPIERFAPWTISSARFCELSFTGFIGAGSRSAVVATLPAYTVNDENTRRRMTIAIRCTFPSTLAVPKRVCHEPHLGGPAGSVLGGLLEVAWDRTKWHRHVHCLTRHAEAADSQQRHLNSERRETLIIGEGGAVAAGAEDDHPRQAAQPLRHGRSPSMRGPECG